MQVWPQKYSNQVCPYCDSKKLSGVAVVKLGREVSMVMSQVSRTGYICQNCKRYHKSHEWRNKIDRAEMRRDINRLQKFLNGEIE